MLTRAFIVLFQLRVGLAQVFIHVCVSKRTLISYHPIVYKRHTKTYIWNVEDLENPVLLNTYVGPVTSIDHNQYIVGDYVSTDVVFGNQYIVGDYVSTDVVFGLLLN